MSDHAVPLIPVLGKFTLEPASRPAALRLLELLRNIQSASVPRDVTADVAGFVRESLDREHLLTGSVPPDGNAVRRQLERVYDAARGRIGLCHGPYAYVLPDADHSR